MLMPGHFLITEKSSTADYEPTGVDEDPNQPTFFMFCKLPGIHRAGLPRIPLLQQLPTWFEFPAPTDDFSLENAYRVLVHFDTDRRAVIWFPKSGFNKDGETK